MLLSRGGAPSSLAPGYHIPRLWRSELMGHVAEFHDRARIFFQATLSNGAGVLLVARPNKGENEDRDDDDDHDDH